MRAQSPEEVEDDANFRRCVEYVHAHAAGLAEGVYGPDSVAWLMYREPATLLAGHAAVLMQMAHPAIAAGVGQHSTFRTDVLGRARATSAALYQLVFGTLDESLAVTRRLYNIHCRVRGRVEDQGVPGAGERYRANAQPLLQWVSVTTTVAGTQAFEAFIRPLTRAEKDRSYRETLTAQATVGVLPETLPPTWEAFERWYDDALTSRDLAVGETARGIADALFRNPVLLGPMERVLTVGFLPPAWREAYGFRWNRAREREFELVVGTIRRTVALAPEPYRYTVAWHQAQMRLQRARGETPSRWARVLNRVSRQWALPTALKRAA